LKKWIQATAASLSVIKSGATTAAVNGTSVKLDAPVTIKDGRTYIPLRFISETLGGVLKYNNTDKSVIVRTPSGQERFEILMSGDLAKAREMAIHYPRTYANKVIEATGEGYTFSYTFPKGEALRFEIKYKGLINYSLQSENMVLGCRCSPLNSPFHLHLRQN
jgi:hypothetical protein